MLSSVLLRLRSEAKTRWRAGVVTAVVTGLVAGAVIAALAGARRTETAYGRFLRQTRAFDVVLTNGGTTATNINRQFDFETVSRLPQVAEAVLVNTYFLSGTLPSGRSLFPSDITPFTSADGRFGRDINRMKVLRGRLPRGQHEIAVTFFGADRLGIDVGDSVRLRLAGPAAMAAEPQGGPAEPFAVVGVVAMQGGFPPLTGGLPPLLTLSPPTPGRTAMRSRCSRCACDEAMRTPLGSIGRSTVWPAANRWCWPAPRS